MVKTSDLNKLNKKLLIGFIILQPILQLVLSVFDDEGFAIGGISVATMVRYALIGTITVLAVIANFKRKCTRLFLCYMGLSGIFAVVQYLNVRDFDEIIYGISMNKGIVQVVLYLSRYIIPMIVLYGVYVLKFDYKDIKIAVLPAVLFVSLSIIVTNLLGVDYISYAYGSNDHPTASILSWFTTDMTKADWRALTSRGLYLSGNELSSLFVVLLPVTAYIGLKEKKHLFMVPVFLQMLAMIMLGTKVSVYGSVLLFTATVLIWLFDSLFNKKKIKLTKVISIVLTFAIFGLILYNSPFYGRITQGEGGNAVYEDVGDTNVSPPDDGSLSTEDALQKKIKYIKENYMLHSIPAVVIYEVYSFRLHPDFWINLMNNVEFSERNNARKIKTLVLEDIMVNKGDVLDGLVGMGEVPVYPEKDFTSQYYYLGAVGMVLFILPYIMILLFAVFTFLRRLIKRRFKPLATVLTMSLGFILVIALYAGHVFEPIYINTFVAMAAGTLTLYAAKEKEE